MSLDDLKTVDDLLNDFNRLKKRSNLLESILSYYDSETMTFDIPAKWKSHRVRPDKLPAESPRHLVKKMITEALSDETFSPFD